MTDHTKSDLLSNILVAHRLRAQVFHHQEFCGAWQINTSGSRRTTFHVVGQGACWLHMGARAPIPLGAGDVLVFPHDASHVLSGSAEPGVSVAPNEAATTILCGYLDFDVSGPNLVLVALPELILMRAEKVTGFDAVGPLVRLIMSEASADRSGRQAVIDKLSDALFVMVLRYYIETASDPRGLFAALADHRLQKAISALSRAPAHPWRLEDLAQTAGMSRTAFAATFHRLVGCTPMQYLVQWRMQQATELLRDPRLSVATVAKKVGYDAEAAFRRAYRRLCGVGPGAIRRAAAATFEMP